MPLPTDRSAGSDPNYYHQRINAAVSYIDAHLQEEIRIGKLAEEAAFSAFHFQRIYKAIRGETPYDTLLRLRLEKAVRKLKFESSLRISDIAYDCGFPSAENFSRQFKARFGVSPSAFRKDKELQNSRIYQEPHPNDFYTRIEESRKLPKQEVRVVVEPWEALPIAFIRGIFGENGSVLVQNYLELVAWAEKHGLPYQGELRRFGMSIDNPEVTPAGKFRYDFALKVDEPLKPEGKIEQGEIPAGLYATAHCRGNLEAVAQTWDYLYKEWLPHQDYVPLHYPAVEEFIQGPEEIGWENFNVKCRIPIKKLK